MCVRDFRLCCYSVYLGRLCLEYVLNELFKVACGRRLHIFSSVWPPVKKGWTFLPWLERSTATAFYLAGGYMYRDHFEPQAQRKSHYTDRNVLITTFCRFLRKPLSRRSRLRTINSPLSTIPIETQAAKTPRHSSRRSVRPTTCWGIKIYARNTTAGFSARPTSAVWADRRRRIRRRADLRATLRETVALQRPALDRRMSLISTLSTVRTTENSCSDRNSSELVCRRSRGRKETRFGTGNWDACQKSLSASW